MLNIFGKSKVKEHANNKILEVDIRNDYVQSLCFRVQMDIQDKIVVIVESRTEYDSMANVLVAPKAQRTIMQYTLQ